MTGEDILVLLGVYVAPSVLAIILSTIAKSRITRLTLLATGTASLLCIAAIVIATADCQRDNTLFYNCQLLPDPIAYLISLVQVVYVPGYLFLGPVLLIVAAIAELLARLGD